MENRETQNREIVNREIEICENRECEKRKCGTSAEKRTRETSSDKKMRETGSMYRIIKKINNRYDAESLGETSTSDLHSINVASSDEEIPSASNMPLSSEYQEFIGYPEEQTIEEERIVEAEYISDWIDFDECDNVESYETIDDTENIVETASDSSQQTAPTNSEAMAERLRNWALKTYQTHSALNGLLEILRDTTSYKLPKDARTLLRTKQCGREIQQIAGGEFWYPGIKAALLKQFENVQPRVNTFSLNFSMDGLPLHKSSRKQFWPILMSIEELPEVPVLMVGNFLGQSKPANLKEYLDPLVNELNELMEKGIKIANKLIKIRVWAIIADSPARAFIKGRLRKTCTNHDIFFIILVFKIFTCAY